MIRHGISPTQYEGLTGEELETDQEVAERLRELWRDLYDDPLVHLSSSRRDN